MSKRTFFKTRIVIDVTSECEIPGAMELEDLIHEGTFGDFNMHVVTEELNTPINSKEATKRLILSGSDPEFFRLDEDGNDLEEDYG